MAKKKKRQGGRPSKYETNVKPMMNAIKGWARDGLTDDQIANNLDVATSTFYEYKKRFPELVEALNTNKAEADYEVENSLFESAKGYYYEEEVMTKGGEVVRLQKYQAPNTTAQIFWLKNRQPTKWRDRQEIDHSGEMNINNPWKDMDSADLVVLAKQLNKDDA